ncbi:flavodoxin family protein [Heliophilum fasciatum]|nr:flavodoxin family protein [Heliophilum fasciatum]
MKYLILMGSPRKNGNTQALLTPLMEELAESGAEVDMIWLHDKQINPCIACRSCQKDWSFFGCIHGDDMQEIFDQTLASDCIILATPIYSWFCTPPMKALLDRWVYGMNKYYGDEIGPSLWAGKRCAIVTTCGYRPEKGADLFEEGIIRYCKHSKLTYVGMLAARHASYKTEFLTEEKIQQARDFGRQLVARSKEGGKA